MVLGPSASRLVKASSVFVETVLVRDEDKKGVFVHSFSEKPELSSETNWSVSNYLIFRSYGRKVTKLKMKRHSQEILSGVYMHAFKSIVMFTSKKIEVFCLQRFSLWLNNGSRMSLRLETQSSTVDRLEAVLIKGYFNVRSLFFVCVCGGEIVVRSV